MDYIVVRSEDYLAHHGVKGQKWGIRRYQNADGSLTAEGRQKYGETQQGYEARKMYKQGTITKEQKKEAVRAKNIVGKVDNVMNLGFGRRIREFETRHKKGMTLASAALGVAGTIAVGVLTGGAAPAMMTAGKAAAMSVLSTAVRTHISDPLMLKYGYNRTSKQALNDINGSGQKTIGKTTKYVRDAKAAYGT